MSGEESSRLASAVAASIAAGSFQPGDRGLIELAGRYAALIDEAATPVSFVAALEHLAMLVDPADEAGRRHLRRVEAALSAQSTLSDLGPKLLSALQALGLSPEARGKLRGGVADDGADRAADALHQLRQRAEQRLHAV